MNPVEWQRTFALSRLSAAPVRFGRAVERAGAGKSCEYGGGELVDACSTPLTPGAAACSMVADARGVANQACNLAVPGATTGILAYRDMASTDMDGNAAFSVLIKSDIDIPANYNQIRVSKTIGLGGVPLQMNLPAMTAGKWYRFTLTFPGALIDRQDILSWGVYAVTASGACNLIVDEAYMGAVAYGIEGFAKDDAVKYDTCPVTVDAYPEGHDFLVLSGLVVGKLADGVTCVSTQRLYPFPGGELISTEIVDASRPIYAMEDQATAGGQVAVVV